MARPEIDFEPISIEDILRFYESYKGKYNRVIDQLVASKKGAVEVDIKSDGNLCNAINNRYKNIFAFSRKNKGYFIDLSVMPEFIKMKQNRRSKVKVFE